MGRMTMCGLVVAFCVSAANALDLAYEFPPGTKLVRKVKESGEFLVMGNVPDVERLLGKISGARVVNYEVGSIEGDSQEVKITGNRTIDIETDSIWIDPVAGDLGPMVLKVTENGDIIEAKTPKCQITPDTMMQFGWWHHITSQLDLVEGLPGGYASKKDSWKNEATISSPAGGTLKVKTESHIVGTSYENGECVWINTKGVLPLNLTFKSPGGTYTVKGQVNLFAVACFNLDKGFATDKKTYHMATLTVSSKSETGQDFEIKLVGAFQSEASLKKDDGQAQAAPVAREHVAVSR